MRRLWLVLLLCACSGSSDNEVDGSVLGYSLNARDALYLVHNGRQLVVISDQDNTCRKLVSQTLSGQAHLLELYLWNAGSTDPTSLVEGTYEVADNGTASLESEVFFGVGPGCDASARWFGASGGLVILLNAGLTEPGERSQVAFRINFGNELLAGHADALYCEVPQTGTIPCVHEAGP
jgi:hypothetical protein